MSLASWLTRIGGSVKYRLIAMNARSHSSFHSVGLAPLKVVKKGFKLFVNREIKRPRESTGQLLDPFLGAGGQRLQNGLKLRKISLYPFLSYHKAKESTDTDSEGTF